MNRTAIPTLIAVLASSLANAGEADVLNARVDCSPDRICVFHVTVQHADDGWDHYANRWEILDSDGKRIALRELAHPHDHEQPFTRSGTITISEGTHTVTVRAHDSVHEYGGKQMSVELPSGWRGL